MLLLSFHGLLLLRLADRRFEALLLKLPPRITRLEASRAPPSGPCWRRTQAAYLEAPDRIQPPSMRPTSSLSRTKCRCCASDRQSKTRARRARIRARTRPREAAARTSCLSRRKAASVSAAITSRQVSKSRSPTVNLWSRGKLGHALRCPGEQTLHAHRDYRRGRWRPAARRTFRLAGNIRCSGPGIVLTFVGGQGFKSQGSRVTAFPLYATFIPPITNWSWRNETQ